MDPAVAAEPQPFYREARAVGAVVPGTFGPQIVRRGAVEYALTHPEEFSSGMEAVDLGQSVPLIPLQVDPPEHRKYRRLLDPIFAPRHMNVLEPDITRWINELIDTFIDDGRCDFATDFAVPLPSSVFLRLVGLPLSELDMFLEMKDGILRPPGERPRRDQGQPEGGRTADRGVLRRAVEGSPEEPPRRHAEPVPRGGGRLRAARPSTRSSASASCSSSPGSTR